MTKEDVLNKVIIKKGRKPKGGKIIIKQNDNIEKFNKLTNIILHLKCSSSDLDAYNIDYSNFLKCPLQYDPTIPKDFNSYNHIKNNVYAIYDETKENINDDICTLQDDNFNLPYDNLLITQNEIKKVEDRDDDIQMNDINNKLKRLKINLYKNSLPDKKPACFWCTYDFDNPSCYIPKYEMDDKIYGYGAFCCPECASAYLMKENIDDSTKFERYHLINQIYGKVYDYTKNIRPAPNPFYLLDKYYGNLSIQEYRMLLKSEHLLLVIDKPLTRLLPELHEDNEEFIENFYGTNERTNEPQKSKQMGMFKVKRESDKQNEPSKTSLLREHFGLT